MTLDIPFDNTYARLPERFYTRIAPTPVARPGLVAVNAALAAELGLDPAALAAPEGLEILSGNATPPGADPLAQAYAGHQFGGWSPQLGDGRAVLLGELVDRSGAHRDLQLKGSGRTPYSRMGDGRAWLGPVLREYIVSEAMHALGIPTTRALAAVTTGETVLREAPLPGAVLTRVASSHVRVGTFQYFAARRDVEALEALTAFVIERHYPEAKGALDLLNAVIARQARLIAQWMGVGFIHGVMNTDNSHVAGETIDYGPCAFMDAYHPATVYSSIDQHGRYAYGRQPEIGVWNMAQLATALLPLIDPDQDKAVAIATEAVHRFPDLYAEAWLNLFGAKIGLAHPVATDLPLIEGLLALMAKDGADFTNTFRALSKGSAAEHFRDAAGYATWEAAWRTRLGASEATSGRMSRANPAVIPRNHQIEHAIQAAVSGDLEPFHRLNAVLASPFALSPEDGAFATPPAPEEVVQATFCGT